jgi:predicted MFS family arabinose efflux permease
LAFRILPGFEFPFWYQYHSSSPYSQRLQLTDVVFDPGFAACFTVANLYYNHPILNLLAHDFGVTEYQSSYIPTLAQAGYAGGLLFLCPLGDLLKRRAFVLLLVWFTATVWCVYLVPCHKNRSPSIQLRTNSQIRARIGLCVTTSFPVFCALSFITSLSTVTPQLMLPLVGDLAPSNRRATALSIVVSGLLLGMLLARFLSGVVAQFIGWRYIYWISFALQYLILILLWLFMPDYPATNPTSSWGDLLRKYPRLLFDILKMLFRHPILVQACLIGFFTSSIFTSFWTTLTFLLSSPPYSYTSLIIGLFALIGIFAMTWGPFFARHFIDKHHPLLSVIIGELICLVGIVVGTYSGKITVAGPIIQALAIDLGVQTSQIANRTAIYAVEPKGRNRVNTAYMVSVFCGQLMGTAAGNRLYEQGGWVQSGSASVGFICSALVLCMVRGPQEKGWVGWSGGWNMMKRRPDTITEKIQTEDVEMQPEKTPESTSEQGPENRRVRGDSHQCEQQEQLRGDFETPSPTVSEKTVLSRQQHETISSAIDVPLQKI